MHVIYAFGDSITYGAWDMGQSGWASRFRTYLDGRNDAPTYYFYPLGIHGETTQGLVGRFDNEFAARRRHDDTTYTFLFAYGANDATWLMDKQQFKASIEEYEKNLRTVIEKVRSLTTSIYFLDITPVNEEFSANLVKKNKSCLNEYVDLYNDKLHDIARTCGVKVVTVNEEFKVEGAANLLVSDGLHPNEAGHDLIYRQVVDTLEPLLDQLER